MRWESLLADLEAEFDAAEAAELAAEVADRTRRELARLRLVDRLRGSVGLDVTVSAARVGTLRGQLSAVGPDWLLLAESPDREVLLPLSAVTTIAGLGPRSIEPGTEGPVARGLHLGHALRALARNRADVLITLIDAGPMTGRLDRVGADFVEVALGRTDPGASATIVTVPFRAIAAVRSA